MPNFTAGTSFTDGVTNDVTALKLNALIADAVPTSSLSLNSTTGTIANFTASTANITLGTIPTLTAGTTTSTAGIFTSGTITTGLIPTLTAGTTTGTAGVFTSGTIATLNSTTPTFLGAITASTNTINVGSGQIYKDATGNVGVGTASPAGKLHVNGQTYIQGTVSGGLANSTLIANSSGQAQIWALGPNASTVGSMTFVVGRSDLSSSNQAITIDSSGNVGIGTSSPSYPMDIVADSNAFALNLRGRSVDNLGYIRFSTNNGATSYAAIGTPAASTLALDTNGTERLRITSGGEVYIAGTTDQGAYNLQVNGTGVWGAGSYVNGSDSRIKEDIQPITSGLDVVDKLNPVTYKYKETWSSDQSIQSGFIAQELLTALDGQIYVDGVVQQGGTDGYYSVAYQNLIPILAKAIHELKSENDSLKSRIEALEAV